ncbi:MAG: hypothetical protein JWN95_1745 [Frankiales bacterium]|nr:hypothetical protein [Frankiales bacterium]
MNSLSADQILPLRAERCASTAVSVQVSVNHPAGSRRFPVMLSTPRAAIPAQHSARTAASTAGLDSGAATRPSSIPPHPLRRPRLHPRPGRSGSGAALRRPKPTWRRQDLPAEQRPGLRTRGRSSTRSDRRCSRCRDGGRRLSRNETRAVGLTWNQWLFDPGIQRTERKPRRHPAGGPLAETRRRSPHDQACHALPCGLVAGAALALPPAGNISSR